MKRSATAGCYFLVRHGVAEDTHPLGDAARALTPEGRASFRTFVEEFGPDLAITGIVTSPLVRAVQTAELLADACGVTDVRVDGALAAETATPQGITALAQELGPGWALVGHNPSMALTVASWRGAAVAPFRKGGIAVFRPDGARPPWTPVYSLSPGRKVEKF